MTNHIAVMTREVIQFLNVRPGGRYLDGTLGGATHTRELLDACAPNGRVLSLDVDLGAIGRAKEFLSEYADRWTVVEGNFRYLDRFAQEQEMAPLDGILLDLGFSSDELEDSSKGLSFLKDGPLDMRLGLKANDDGMTAAEIVNTWTESDIEKMLRVFGEEQFARRIAKGICEARKAARIVGTLDLVSVIRKSVPQIPSRIHPATRTFQALRIAVNDELESLKQAIVAAHRVLVPGGILAIISFHSLEDRIVKNAFANKEDWEAQIKKPLLPSNEEISVNSRSRSAKLRFAKKV